MNGREKTYPGILNSSTRPSLGEITRHAHHGRDAHTRTDQDHAFCLCPVEDEGPVRGLDLHLVTYPQFVMQPTGHQALRLAFDRDFDPIAPGGRRCDRVGALGRDASWRNMEC